ncbi:MAG: hypothetical protein PVJ55_03805 [Anaerolineae bacterium]|jgi:hypothetical protein
MNVYHATDVICHGGHSDDFTIDASAQMVGGELVDYERCSLWDRVRVFGGQRPLNEHKLSRLLNSERSIPYGMLPDSGSIGAEDETGPGRAMAVRKRGFDGRDIVLLTTTRGRVALE